jgi:hypothetical protein
MKPISECLSDLISDTRLTVIIQNDSDGKL